MSNWDILLLDESKSMEPNKTQLKDGFNDLVKQQITEKSKNKFTVIGFNDTTRVIKDEFFPDVSKINDDDINIKGQTALIDAVGEVYNMVIDQTEYKNIKITIITDGFENCSKTYTKKDLDSLKETLDNDYTTNIVFIGADISCIKNNIIKDHVSHSVDYNGDIERALLVASRTMSSGRESVGYIPEGIVYENENENEEGPPRVKRQRQSSITFDNTL